MLRTLVVAGLLLTLLAPPNCKAYETDQFSHRLDPIKDSTAVLDKKVNQTLRDIVKKWRGPRDNWKFVNAVFFRIGGYNWVDHLEKWAMRSPQIDRLKTSRHHSIYSHEPFWVTRVVKVFGVCPTIKLNGQLIGTDKLGHFLSQGRKFYHRYLQTHSEAKAAQQSAYTERAIFGMAATGVYSNADLVANYEGYRFYRSLFEDNIVGHKKAILAWRDNHWVIQRKFTFADHVNAYWDEALNIGHYDHILYPYMKKRLETYCPEYYKAPEKWVIKDEKKLKARYTRLLELRPSPELRLDHLCRGGPAGNVKATVAAQQR